MAARSYSVARQYFGWWLSVVVSTSALFNEVNRHWARLVLGWVTVNGQVNHLGMWLATYRSTQPYTLSGMVK